jgi:hypothetical protein
LQVFAADEVGLDADALESFKVFVGSTSAIIIPVGDGIIIRAIRSRVEALSEMGVVHDAEGEFPGASSLDVNVVGLGGVGDTDAAKSHHHCQQ